MRFDWKKFCDEHHIHYVTEGPNTARGCVSIKCPLCGGQDPSQHMGLSLNLRNPWWGCLRNGRHRGVDPARLIMTLLNIGFAHARILVENAGAAKLDDYDKVMEQFREQAEREERQQARSFRDAYEAPVASAATPKALPQEFRRLTDGFYAKRFVEYLAVQRGFGKDAWEIAERYELYYAISGDYSWRLIFPLRTPTGKLLGWQGRDIRSGAKVRYLTSAGLPEGALLAFAFGEGTATVLAGRSERLAIVEGPLDALKLDFYGRSMDVRAIASMGTAPARARISALRAVQARRKFVIFDSDAFSQALAFCEEIPGSKWVPLPEGIKDPGEMQVGEVKTFLTSIAKMS